MALKVSLPVVLITLVRNTSPELKSKITEQLAVFSPETFHLLYKNTLEPGTTVEFNSNYPFDMLLF